MAEAYMTEVVNIYKFDLIFINPTSDWKKLDQKITQRQCSQA